MLSVIERIRAVAFDLDGTLVDSAPDLLSAVNMVLREIGCAPLSERRVRKLIGSGTESLISAALTQSMGRAPGAAECTEAIRLFQHRYAECLYDHSRVYPGVVESLRALGTQRVRVCCVTNKRSIFALPLLDDAGLSQFLEFTLCADRLNDHKPRPDLLIAACARLGIAPRELLVVGDSRADVGAARAAGSPVAAVDYGYNGGRPVEEERPDWIIDDLSKIVALLTARRSVVVGA